MKKRKVIELIVGKDVENIPEAIKKLRLIQGLSQDDMYVRTGIPQNQYSMHENFKRRLHDDKIQLIVDGLDTELIFRLTLEEENDIMDNTNNKNIIEIEGSSILINTNEPEVINDPRKLVAAIASNTPIENIKTDLKVSLKSEYSRLQTLKNLDINTIETEIYDENNNFLKELPLNENNTVSINSIFKNESELMTALSSTKTVLEKELDIKDEQIKIEKELLMKHNFGEYSFNWFIPFNKEVYLELYIHKNGIEDRSTTSQHCFSRIIFIQNQFNLEIIPAILEIFKENDIATDTEQFKKFMNKLNETNNMADKYLCNRGMLYEVLPKEKGKNCLEPYSPYIFGLSTDLMDINFWYYDASDSGYERDSGACIGYDINFVNIDGYCVEHSGGYVAEKLYINDNYKKLSLEYLAELGLKKMSEILNSKELLKPTKPFSIRDL